MMNDIINSGDIPTAVFAANDAIAFGANLVYVARNLSIKTPLKAKIPCQLVIRESCDIAK